MVNFGDQKLLATNWPQPKKQAAKTGGCKYLISLKINGRGERIRTSDLTVPNRALYQAEPRPECRKMITRVNELRTKVVS
jgi:hypothetical protein